MLASVMRCPILSHKGGSGHISSKRLRILSYCECPRIRQKPLSTRLRKLLDRHFHRDWHICVVLAAKLRTLTKVNTLFHWLEPKLGNPARYAVLFTPKAGIVQLWITSRQ